MTRTENGDVQTVCVPRADDVRPAQARLVAVVGPSGVGKDSLIAAMVAARPILRVARRCVTRPEEAGGEPFEGIGRAEFEMRRDAGAFALHWEAHGLLYGIPEDELRGGGDVLANLSRGVLAEAARLFPGLVVLSVCAPPEVVEARLRARGREDAGDVARRLARAAPPPPESVRVVAVDNGGALQDAASAALAALEAAP